MNELCAVDGSPLAPESLRMLEYLRTRAAELNAAAISARIAAAAHDLEEVVAAQTNVRGAEELRHLIAGRRPPLPPVYEALHSGAGQWTPWDLLVEELGAANRAMLAALASA